MDVSGILDGHQVATSASLFAFHENGKLRVSCAQTPERVVDFSLRTPEKEIQTLRWSPENTSIAVLSPRHVEVVDLNDSSHRTRLDNGSGGLGRFASADFIDNKHLLTTWEFGRAKLWELSSGRGVDLGDLKTTCDGRSWQLRPENTTAKAGTLALLSRPTADDALTLHFVGFERSMPGIKLPSVDAQCLCWSPNGRWLAVLDTPTASASVHFFTPDGHHFRSYPSASLTESESLGVKALRWSGNSCIIALLRFNGKIELLNAKSFSPMAVIEHSTTIDQRSLTGPERAPVWLENVSASNERSYHLATQPLSPPLTRTKTSTEPSELGIAEACSSCDGSYLATRDERMLNTVWIWSLATPAAHAVVIQHCNVRRMHWHPSRPETLMLDCAEGIAYIFNVLSRLEPPVALTSFVPGTPSCTWLSTSQEAKPIIVAATKSCFRFLYPEGRDAVSLPDLTSGVEQPAFEEGASEDSVLDVLSGRRPLPPKQEPSYTELVDLEADIADDMEDGSAGLDDTFRAKRKPSERDVDPFDDSQIF